MNKTNVHLSEYSCKHQINWQYCLDKDIIFSLGEHNFVYGTDKENMISSFAQWKLEPSTTIVPRIFFFGVCEYFIYFYTSNQMNYSRGCFQITDIILLAFCEFLWLILCLCNALIRTHSFSRMHTIQPKRHVGFVYCRECFCFHSVLLFDITVLISAI